MRIAEHFSDEVRAAGIDPEGWSIVTETGAVLGNTPAGLQAVIDAHDPTPTLAMQKAEKVRQIRRCGERRLAKLAEDYGEFERGTWSQQAAEADAYAVTGSLPEDAMLVKMAAEREITVAEMVAKVDAARLHFNANAGAVLGAQHRMETAAWAAEDQAALDAIDPTNPSNWP